MNRPGAAVGHEPVVELGLCGRAAVGLYVLFPALVAAILIPPWERHEGRSVAYALYGVALTALYLVPALLGVMSRHGRPQLRIVAGALGFLLVPTSMSITPLLVVPSILMLSAAIGRDPFARPHVPTPVLAIVVFALAFGAFLVALTWSTQACWGYSTSSGSGGGCTSRAPTIPGTVVSLGLTALLLTVSWVLSTPRAERRSGRTERGRGGDRR